MSKTVFPIADIKLEGTPLDQALLHIHIQHQDADGYIALGRKTKNGGWYQRLYPVEKIEQILTSWLGSDTYFSQNTFYKPSRRIEDIRQLRALYVDLDCYLLNYDPEWLIGRMDRELFRKSIPEPNIIISSGRGLNLIWLLTPVPYKALPLWQAVQRYLVDQLKDYGADLKATDAARVLRIAGTTNSKSGTEVTVYLQRNYRYTLRQIQEEYLPELTLRSKTKKKTKRQPSKVVGLYNVYSLHAARLKDLRTLVELRGFDVEGHRELICFLYRYWSCCFLQDEKDALMAVLELNAEFRKPLSEREVIIATKSAEKAYAARNNKEANRIAKEKGYPGAGYNVSNQKLIEWLDITPEEQKHLSTIIGPAEKRRRKMLANRKLRGSVSREEYLAEQKNKTMDKLEQLREVLMQNPKAKRAELAELLGVSVPRIAQLKKQLQSV